MKSPFHLVLLFLLGTTIDTIAQRRPLLYPNPSVPGKHPLAEVKVKMRQRFDADQNGVLSLDERNTMRLATKEAANRRMEAFLAGQRKRNKERESSNQPPDRWLKLYDKNRDRRFDSAEWNAARDKEMRRITATFDTNQNHQIEGKEKKAVIAFLKENKHNGYDAYILRLVSGIESRSNNRGALKSSRHEKFDLDNNGIASKPELDAIRAHEAESRSKKNER